MPPTHSQGTLRLTAALLGTVAAATLIPAWFAAVVQGIRLEDVITAAYLTPLLILANRFPIHIRVSSKVYMGSVVLFLMAALLPPALAGTAAGIGLLAAELESRSRTGNYLSVIAGQAARWALLAVLGSLIAHASFGVSRHLLLNLLLTSALLLLGDMVTVCLLLAPVVKEPRHRLIRAIAREGAPAEGAQYLVGLMGALIADEYRWALALLLLPTALVYLAFKRAKEMRDGTRTVLETMADMVDRRDPYTGGHSRRVTELAAGLLRAMGKHGPEVELIISAARVHDIGKINVPEEILLKDGALSEEEWAVMKLHPEQGADLVKRYPDFARGVEIIRHHHERWDGTGYPHRLSRTEIPFGARVIAVADAYDAMTTDRPYRRGLSPDRAAQILREGRGIQWDPTVVDAFLQSIAGRLSTAPEPRLHLIPARAGERSA